MGIGIGDEGVVGHKIVQAAQAQEAAAVAAIAAAPAAGLAAPAGAAPAGAAPAVAAAPAACADTDPLAIRAAAAARCSRCRQVTLFLELYV